MARTGRPAFKATAKLRRQVAELISCGMSQDEVARAIGCSTPTLVKHFPDELATGAARKRAEVIGLLYRNARAGNVSAQKQLETMTRAGAAAEAISRRGDAEGGAPAQATPVPAPRLGKKEQKQAAAEQVTGRFAPPNPPKLVVNNG